MRLFLVKILTLISLCTVTFYLLDSLHIYSINYTFAFCCCYYHLNIYTSLSLFLYVYVIFHILDSWNDVLHIFFFVFLHFGQPHTLIGSFKCYFFIFSFLWAVTQGLENESH
jgi:hypothetical protein